MKSIYLLFLASLFALNLHAQSIDAEKIVEKCMPSVVYIETENGLGSGFVVDSRGYIITNYHVIEEARNAHAIKIEFKNGNQYICEEIIKQDIYKDIALLKIKSGNYPALPLANKKPKTGVDVVALGSPIGLKFTSTKGNISNSDINEQFEDAQHLVQTSIAVNPGNSGGPIINKNGQVVAIVVSGFRKMANINFAIHAEALRQFLPYYIQPQADPLISDDQLKTLATREMTQEEKTRDSLANIEKIEQERTLNSQIAQAKQDSLNRERARQQAEITAKQERELQLQQDAMYFDRMNKDQQEELLKQRHLQERARLAKQNELDIQRIEDAAARERLALDRDILYQRQAEDKQRRERQQYFQRLPQRFCLRAGGGAHYYLGTLGHDHTIAWDPQRIGYNADLSLLYRIDRDGDNLRSRATAIGFNFKLGAIQAPSASALAAAQNWTLPNQTLNPQQTFISYGLTFLLREWLKIETNLHSQFLHSPNSTTQLRGGQCNIGFIARFNRLEIELYGGATLFGDFKKMTTTTGINLYYRGLWGRF